MNERFDLEHALATWRHVHAQRRVFSPEDLDELERHLRDQTADLVKQGWTADEAFQHAVARLGDVESGAREYQKIRWAKVKQQGQRIQEVHWWGMLCINYLKIAWRTVQRHKGYALVNGFGLVLGMASCLVLVQYAVYEYSFDSFHGKKERLYRGALKGVKASAASQVHGGTGHMFGPTMANAVPGIARFARIHPNYGSAVLTYDALGERRTFKENRILYADSSFLQMFDFSLYQGKATTALQQPHTIVVSTSTARKYFGDENPLGKSVQVTGWVRGEYVVTGVFEDVPATSHLQFDILLPMADLLQLARYQAAGRGWERRNFATYFELHETADPAAVEAAMLEAYLDVRGDVPDATNPHPDVYLQPLEDIHLNQAITGPAALQKEERHVLMFVLLGGIVLALALVNYVNLTTARAFYRAREVGVRKAVGAYSQHVLGQFLLESAVLVGGALSLAVGIVWAVLPAINEFADIHLTRSMLVEGEFMAILAAIFVGATVLAGGYPAWAASRFQARDVLKGRMRTSASQASLRKALVVFQFAVSIGLIGGTLAIYQQVRYMLDLDNGFDLEQVLVIERPRLREEAGHTWAAEMEVFKADVRSIAHVEQVALSATTPGRGFNWYASVYRANQQPSEAKAARATNIDEDFAGVYGLDLVAGESFREGMPLSDSPEARVLVNETLVRRVGFASNAEAVGEVLKDSRGNTFVIHGVLSDFMWSSAHDWSEAVVLLYETRYGDLSLRVRTERLSQTLTTLEEAFHEHFPGNPFVYTFADAAFDAQYKDDQRVSLLVTGFAGMALLIACLGLFGLAVFTVAQRTKEIGIRKVLGASASQVMTLLLKDVVTLVGIALVIALPVTYTGVQHWLNDFPYRMELNVSLMLLAGGVVVGIALLTVSYQTIRAALADPVESLRYE